MQKQGSVPTPKPYASVVQTFGSEGIGPGKFTDARHVAVDGQGNIYVAEWEDVSRVQKFDPNGNYLSQFTPDEGKGIVPSLTVDRSGIAYVLQTTQLGRYKGTSGDYLGELSIDENSGFDDMATTVENGVMAITDHGFVDALIHFNSQGKVLKTIPNPISGQTEESELGPHVAVDGRNNVYILGTFTKAVYKYGPNGKYITRFGSQGDNPGQFRAPNSIAIDNQGRVYVSDFGEVDVFSPEGRSLGSFSMPSGPAFGLILNGRDELYVASRPKVYILHKVIICDLSKVWKLRVNKESRAGLCLPEVSFKTSKIAALKEVKSWWYRKYKASFLTNFQSRSIKFKLGE